MGLIIFHAGMAKTGSSSIQRWLSENLDLLREVGIHPIRVRQPSPEAPIEIEPARPGLAKSKLVEAVKRPGTRASAAKRIFDALDDQASSNGAVVMSSEGYQLLFWDDDGEVLADLDQLARVHTVRVAYYVRPQHTSLESSWRQWGFRHPDPPSTYLRRQEARLRYLQTLEAVRRAAPRVSFEMRPFRRDLLEGGDVVVDFARTFLGVQNALPPASDDGWSNRGFPLEFAILLRDAPPGLFWSSELDDSIHDNTTLNRLRSIVTKWDIPERQETIESRVILQCYSRRTFEPENQELIKTLGWKADDFIPPIRNHDGQPNDSDLGMLDDLWKSKASEVERQLFFSALHELASVLAIPVDARKCLTDRATAVGERVDKS